jgi:hypothetical protein
MHWWHAILCALNLHPYRVVFLAGHRPSPTGFGLVCPYCGLVKL